MWFLNEAQFSSDFFNDLSFNLIEDITGLVNVVIIFLRADARNAIPDCGGEILRRVIAVRFQCPLSIERPDFA